MIGLLACSKTKLVHAAPARELYVSPLFRLSLSYLEARCEDVLVLSALHGLVPLHLVIAPYDARMADMPKYRRDEWGVEVEAGLWQRYGCAPITLLAGADYAVPLLHAMHHGWEVHQPLAGMMIGARLAFLARDERERSSTRSLVDQNAHDDARRASTSARKKVRR